MRTLWIPLWIGAGIATLAVEFVGALASSAPYSFARQTISDLGMTTCTDAAYAEGPVAVCSPLHPLVNGVWAIAAVAIAVGAVGVRAWLGRSTTATVAAVGAAVGGLGQLGVAIWPTDVDLTLHAIAGLAGFVGQNVSLIAVGVALKRHRVAAGIAIAGGVVGIVATLLVLASETLGLPIGIVERIAVYPFLLGLILLGALAAVERARTPSLKVSDAG